MSFASKPLVAVGPAMPGWGSWEWLGAALLHGLRPWARTSPFDPWAVPDADVVVVVKHPPPREWVEQVCQRSAIVYCPIDHYGGLGQILDDAEWLARCARIVVHCRRLVPFLDPFAPAVLLDHPVKYATPTRQAYQKDGPLLWVGVRSNLPAVASWVNDHPLPLPLDVLTNPERPGEVPPPGHYGFRADRDVRIHEWTPDRHRALAAAARAALDVKGDDFRSRHKPPAKAVDFVASGVPLALDPGGSCAEHLASLGLDVPSPRETHRWLSEGYWNEVRQLGERLARDHAPDRVAEAAWRVIAAAMGS